ncbi:MAG TPA: sugar phosphate isomerase/epimerase [Gemmatimonadaceae bacterium]|nr:sugar phosphate isomerase/epimerase [Gemmatimonadaceae bacterium]
MADLDRRSFLTTLGGAALALAGCSALAPGALVTSAPRRKLGRIGIQLYTVRTQARADIAGTLGRLAGLGYREIEFWGSHALTPRQIRGVLDQNGLTAPSMHIGIPSSVEGWTPIFESANALGSRWITAASPPFQPRTPEDWKRLAASFNDAGKRVKDAGFRFAYHNHREGMKSEGGAAPFETLLADTDPALVGYELDIHWAYAGGADAVDLLTRHPTRFRMLHVKDSTGAPDYRQTDVGAGTYPWAGILDAASRAGVEHYFIEHDSPADAMVFAKTSLDYLAGVEF